MRLSLALASVAKWTAGRPWNHGSRSRRAGRGPRCAAPPRRPSRRHRACWWVNPARRKARSRGSRRTGWPGDRRRCAARSRRRGKTDQGAVDSGFVEAPAFDQVGEVVVELAEIGDVAIGRAAAAMAAQADRIDGGACRLQRLGELQHLHAGAGGARHQHDCMVGPAGIEAVIEGCAIARLEALQPRQLGKVPLGNPRYGIAGREDRRDRRRVEGDDGSEGAGHGHDEGADGDQEAMNHGGKVCPPPAPIHRPFADLRLLSRSVHEAPTDGARLQSRVFVEGSEDRATGVARPPAMAPTWPRSWPATPSAP